MLLFIFTLAICGIAVKGECQTAYMGQAMQTCIDIVTRTQTSEGFNDLEPEQKRALWCSNYRQGLTCEMGVINECANSTGLMYHGVTLEQARVYTEKIMETIEKMCPSIQE
ncbi:uncharacterized protein LOC121390662 isoform X2 [Gigantopelta aegis]|uniref:uncharacterized protein LOC121390662 isoform X1 n=1 Tax=Gigantopelta aegis TaxID=1735272 RepID=UPI001B88D2F0|nr:uncharacterized protein LOC121390662 isoform X1 [Gigantopelta aegis]XP_041378462.1 uncharacterized protein LOC121390662 isoform X2 [Gigantopelta aegis]